MGAPKYGTQAELFFIIPICDWFHLAFLSFWYVAGGPEKSMLGIKTAIWHSPITHRLDQRRLVANIPKLSSIFFAFAPIKMFPQHHILWIAANCRYHLIYSIDTVDCIDGITASLVIYSNMMRRLIITPQSSEIGCLNHSKSSRHPRQISQLSFHSNFFPVCFKTRGDVMTRDPILLTWIYFNPRMD